MSVLSFRSLASNLLARYQWARQSGLTFGGLRDVWGVLGYAPYGTLTTQDFVEKYERGGVAGKIVDVLPNNTWAGELWLEEDEDPKVTTPFEQAWEDLEKKHGLREKMLRTDKLSRLSTYSVLLIGAPGDMESELPKGTPEQLLYFQPFLGGGGPSSTTRRSQAGMFSADAVVAEYVEDGTDPRFGQPKSYNLKRTDVNAPMLQRPVHHSRVVHVAEGLLRDDVYGQPALERVWNLLDDLDKVGGGGAEAFWMRANAGLHLNVDKDMQIAVEKDAAGNPVTTELDKVKAEAEAYAHQMTRMIRTRGIEINQLGSDVANFAGPLDAVITLIAGATGIPKRILVGSEMGELASTQDRENFRDLISGRQMNYAGPRIVRPLVDRLIEYGYLPTPGKKSEDGTQMSADKQTASGYAYKVKWPTIEVLGEKEKLEGAKAWSSVNQSQGETVFTSEEIRDKWAGLKPLTDEQKAAEEEKAKKKSEEALALIKAKRPEPGEEDDKKALPFGRRAAQMSEDAELIRVLEDAVRTGATDVVDAILAEDADA